MFAALVLTGCDASSGVHEGATSSFSTSGVYRSSTGSLSGTGSNIGSKGASTASGGSTTSTGGLLSSSTGTTTGGAFGHPLVLAHVIRAHPAATDPSYPLDPILLGIDTFVRDALARAQAAGVDALMLDELVHLNQQATEGSFDDILIPADDAGILVAPCFDNSGSWFADGGVIPPDGGDPQLYRKEVVLNYVRSWVTAAAGHPSALLEGGLPVIFTYEESAIAVVLPDAGSPSTGAVMQAGADAWAWVRAQAFDAGAPFLLANDAEIPGIDFSTNEDGGPSALQELLEYVPVSDAFYTFGNLSTGWWELLRPLFAGVPIPYFGGLSPGYNRTVPATGGFKSPQGTLTYRQNWERQLDAGLDWAPIITWDDYTEHTNIDVTSDWNRTRLDLTTWYAAALAGRPIPFGAPTLYVTTAAALYTDAGIYGPHAETAAEALIVNPSGEPMSVTLEIDQFAPDGGALGVWARQTAVVAAQALGDARLSFDWDAGSTGSGGNASSLTAPGWLQAFATATLPDGGVLAVAGPPTIVAAGPVETDYTERTTYASQPSSAQLAGQLTLALFGDGGTASAIVSYAGPATLVELDLLHESWRLQVADAGAPFRIAPLLPVVDGGIFVAGGYVARGIDANGNVRYSTPAFSSQTQ